MTPDSSDRTTAVPPPGAVRAARAAAAPGTPRWLARGTLAIDGRRVPVGWFRAMNTDAISVTRAFRDRFVLLVVPPEATTSAAAAAMAKAADATNSDRPADILTASGIATRDTGSQAPPRRSQGDSQPLVAELAGHATT